MGQVANLKLMSSVCVAGTKAAIERNLDRSAESS
jgi:hypothetical protein